MITAASVAKASLNVETDALTQALLSDGYLIVPRLLDAEAIDRLCAELDPHFTAAPFGDGLFYGGETKRFGAVLKRSRAAQGIALHPAVMNLVERVLGDWCQCLQLNLTQAIEIHPGAPVQVPHRDQDMWAGPKGAMHYMVNVMWALDDFTAENGATRLWPKSHLGDQDAMLPEEEAVPAVMPRGSACFFLGSTLHSGGANRSAAPRRGLIVSYCLGWLKPWENQWLAYPPPVAREFPPEIAALVGYRQHLPSLGNYEGQCPSLLLGDDPLPDHLPFTDALKEEHHELMRQYYAGLGAGASPVQTSDGVRDEGGASLAAG
ncbi:phytanoyl-CoA dioxygenase family protein [Hyphococcus luteus]|uniref:Phytanoyl-CoA dioxygenase n=1 Tax=Hyphococcus luteus TaxID=2058213 RepID=A0A2S7K507_9PROT|nr:phytanoyl-CoA dioxygenase family protein [Marinicaulis flavus]PQA87579.1 phytanoyl-CoA dioxygenase [Marinicaulis flavus]